jgi:hypothetical protein
MRVDRQYHLPNRTSKRGNLMRSKKGIFRIAAVPVFVVALLALNIGGASGKLLGDKGQLDPVLEELVRPLHAEGIDVFAGDTSVKRPTKRPRIALLTGMPAARPTDFAELEWMASFKSGATGCVLGAKTSEPGSAARTEDEFVAKWQKADPGKRVFLSFTSKDVEWAEKAAQVLQAKGYVTFVYLKSGESTPRYDPKFVGEMFSQASHHIVLDTENARKSPGVWLEAEQARKFMVGGSETSSAPVQPKEPIARNRSKGGFDEEAFTEGVRGGWVVTENPNTPKRLFIHRDSRGGMLNDLMYRVKVEADGSWTVFKSSGARAGSIRDPPSVSIGSCNCR